MEFDIRYTNKEITPWGGMVFLKRMRHKIGFRELIEGNIETMNVLVDGNVVISAVIRNRLPNG